MIKQPKVREYQLKKYDIQSLLLLHRLTQRRQRQAAIRGKMFSRSLLAARNAVKARGEILKLILN